MNDDGKVIALRPGIRPSCPAPTKKTAGQQKVIRRLAAQYRKLRNVRSRRAR